MIKKTTIIVAVLVSLPVFSVAQTPNVGFETVLLTTDPVPAQSGESVDVTFKVRNTGNIEAENVKLEIVDSHPFELEPDRQKNYSLGDMTPGESYHISTNVIVDEESSDGLNHLKVRITKGDFQVIEKVPVEVQSEDIDLNMANLQTTPDDLKPDTENNRLNLELVNNGEKTAENVVVNLEFSEVFEEKSSFSNRHALGNIEDGEVKEASFDFDISENASEGPEEVKATISYTASDNTAEIDQSQRFDVYITGKPQYRIKSVESDLKAGEKGEIRLNVENFGSVKSDSTRVRILDNSDLPFEFDSSNKFMGSLRSGKDGKVVFEPKIESDAPAKGYLLDFEVRGVKDSEVFVEQKVRSFEVKEADQRDIPTGAIALIVSVVTVFGILLLRKRSVIQSKMDFV